MQCQQDLRIVRKYIPVGGRLRALQKSAPAKKRRDKSSKGTAKAIEWIPLIAEYELEISELRNFIDYVRYPVTYSISGVLSFMFLESIFGTTALGCVVSVVYI